LTDTLLSLKEQAQAQGWNKAQKLEGRNTTQGLIGLYVEGNSGAMVELNCETDFVAKNNKFHTLLNEVVNAKFHHLKSSPAPASDVSVQVN
jgi:elongation factor Ts